jgi:RNA polymerase sigma factor (TIGR02999 family)
MPEPEPREQPPSKPPQPANELLPLVYDQLRQLARQRMTSERLGHTLQATALVHEAYMRLAGSQDKARFTSAAHFYKAAAEAMRRILIEYARARGADKRGGSGKRVSFGTVLDLAAAPNSEDILAFDEALSRLESQAVDAAAIVRLRFYAGLSVEETAETLGMATRTVNREWQFARAWLYRELGSLAEP